MDWKKLRNANQPTAPMFNLEQAINEWRKQMSASGINSPAVLDELESHVREEVERQTSVGVDASKAFASAVQKMGAASTLRKEFKKSLGAVLAEKLMLAAAVLVLAFGIFLSSVAVVLCYLTPIERIIGAIAMVLTVVTAFVWPAFVSRLPVIRSRSKLQLAQVLCLAVGFGLCTLHVQLIVNRFAHADGMVPAVGFFGVFFIAIGFAAAAGLDRAARDWEETVS